MAEYDELVLGAGLGGLAAAALLAKRGRRVLVLEAHDVPGGYAHTFRMKSFRFCAQVHYIFNCGEGESVHRFLSALGIADRVPFERLDPEGFDHVVVAGERVRVPNGLSKFRDRLQRRFPDSEVPLRAYFRIVSAVAEELRLLESLPDPLDAWTAITSAYRFRHVIRYLRSTLDDVYDRVGMPLQLRAILAGQCGDYLLPPRDVSFLLHVALVDGYDRGAYYPKHHYFHFVDSIVNVIEATSGSKVLLKHEVDRIVVDGAKVIAVTTKDGGRFTAKRYISNIDPRRTQELCGAGERTAAKLGAYDYSCGTITMYLAVKGFDLRAHGFGSFNVWHYPHPDLNRIYDDQLLRHDLKDPWLFLSTPTLHSSEPGLCPPDHQIIEVATAADYAYFAHLRKRDRRAYNREKKKIGDTIIDVLEAHYLPGIRDHLAFRLTGTPVTNERFCGAPKGNSYGAALTPKNVTWSRKPYQSGLDNLWLVNATAGFPSVAGTIGAGLKLAELLE